MLPFSFQITKAVFVIARQAREVKDAFSVYFSDEEYIYVILKLCFKFHELSEISYVAFLDLK